MKLTLLGHSERYCVEQLQLALFARETPGEAESALHRGRVWLTATAKITIGGQTTRASRRLRCSEESVRLRRRILQQAYYLAALPHLPQPPAWGALAGVRPTKLSTRHLLAGGTRESAGRELRELYFVTPERCSLALDCSESTVAAVAAAEPSDISMYIGIPFCPTRCAYCSFVSRSIGRKTELLAPYLDALMQEIRVTGQLLAASGRRIRTLYIGGGTPTTLSCEQLELLLAAIGENFDLSRCIEFTVEGGRPDTLSPEKLNTLARGGVNRMSINPQSMSDRVLRACGRPHTARDVEDAYRWAQQAGFEAINMDLIAGLPQDDFDGFRRSLDAVAALAPANITVHTLALKKGADLFERPDSLSPAAEIARMVDFSEATLRALGYRPYYLYRQKYMAGSFENVGWQRGGTSCLYNIYMMEEVHSILSLGGGGMTKINLPGGRLRRFHNPKFPEQYLQALSQLLDEKQEIFSLLGESPERNEHGHFDCKRYDCDDE